MNVLEAILAVFSAVGGWISDAVTDLVPMFYTAESGLSFLGVLAVAGLAFSVVFLELTAPGHLMSDHKHESPLIAGKSYC